jgi:hypothetical protein
MNHRATEAQRRQLKREKNESMSGLDFPLLLF